MQQPFFFCVDSCHYRPVPIPCRLSLPWVARCSFVQVLFANPNPAAVSRFRLGVVPIQGEHFVCRRCHARQHRLERVDNARQTASRSVAPHPSSEDRSMTYVRAKNAIPLPCHTLRITSLQMCKYRTFWDHNVYNTLVIFPCWKRRQARVMPP